MLPIATVSSIFALHLLLIFPNRFEALSPAGFLHVSIELPLILALICVVSERWRPTLRRLLVGAIAAVAVLKLADIATHAALNRPFNPVLDLHLAAAGWDLLAGAVGTPTAVLGALAAACAVTGAAIVADRSLRVLTAVLPGFPVRPWPAAATVGCLLSLAAGGGLMAPSAGAGHILADRAIAAATGLRDLRDFRRETATDPFADIPADRLLAGLAGRDLLLVFVESYGRSAVEDPRYAPVVLPALDELDAAAARRGAHVRSGWLTAPMVGGQSWLAHGTLLTGLWIDGQRRYDSLVAGQPRSLVTDFGRGGWRTAAFMPAITEPWPEGRRFGFDAVYAASDLGYRGEPFNWITMPDQYTLSALQRLELEAPARQQPVMAMLALVSSHAPWTPVPPVIDWEAVGDGSIFTPYAREGDPPDVVWRDRERVRDQYALSIAYVLRTMASYVEAYGREDLVTILVGDHQPAPLITGEAASYDVPIHIVTADEGVLDAIADWGWTPGARPGPAPVWRMDEFRARLIATFTSPAEAISRLTNATDGSPIAPN